MRILITGGAGFIGQHLARSLASRHTLVALDSLNPQVHEDPTASASRFPGEVIVGDVCDEDVWGRVSSFDALVHLAAETGTAQSMYEHDRYRQTNVAGTRLAAEAARRHSAPLVFLSSRAVYGEGRYRGADGTLTFGSRPDASAVPEASQEGDPLLPVSVYGHTKAEAEAVARGFSADVPVTIVRPQNVVGPGQALHNPYTGVLAAFLARLREAKPVQIYGDGHETRDFVDVRDVADLLVWCLGRRGVGDALVLNAGTGTRTSLIELGEYAIAASPLGGSSEHVDVQRDGDIEHACADLGGLRSAGAPLPRRTTGDAVASFIRESWELEGADSAVWDAALSELKSRGLAR